MNSTLITLAIQTLIKLLIGSDVFTRIEAAVVRWADKKIAGAEKRQGVLDELEVIGLKVSKSVTNLAVELAVQKLNNQVAQSK